jgi:hypothetical protein
MVLALIGMTAALTLTQKTVTERTNQRDKLQDWQDDVVTTVSLATVEPNAQGVIVPLKATDIKGALTTVIKERDRQRVVFREITRTTQQDRARAVAAEGALAREQSRNRAQAAKSTATINRLSNMKPSGNVDKDEQMIEEALDAPWTGWTKQ